MLTMRLILLGAPGTGKGTQGERLARRLGLPHISSGDLLRAQVRDETELGRTAARYLDKGRLVPDELVSGLVMPAVLDAAANGGYILDGFPRSVAQAIKADELAARSGAGAGRVIYLSAPSQILVRRLLDRAAATGRSDDTLDVITDRLRIFESETSPLVDYYRSRGVLVEVAADRSEDEVTEAIVAAL